LLALAALRRLACFRHHPSKVWQIWREVVKTLRQTGKNSSKLLKLMPPRKGEIAARLRAARGYKGFTQAQLAERLDISVETLSRMENGKGPVSDRRRARIGQLCGVPPEFMDAGFAPLERPITDVEQRLYDLERKVEGLGTTTSARLGSRLKPVQAKDGVEPGVARVLPAKSQRRGGSRPQDQDGPRTQPGSQ
jgi:transcriptional regulator with XRE-family HTH domain